MIFNFGAPLFIENMEQSEFTMFSNAAPYFAFSGNLSIR
jgi:hypothetical protein